ISQAVRFGSNLLLTRLLVPEMFGVMAVATSAMVGLQMFSDVGLKPNVIYSKRGHEPVFLNTAWLFQIFPGAVLCLFALCVSLLLFLANGSGMAPKDTVYADPKLPYVIAILAVTPIIVGFESTKLLEASRNLLIGRVTQIEITAQITALLCM